MGFVALSFAYSSGGIAPDGREKGNFGGVDSVDMLKRWFRVTMANRAELTDLDLQDTHNPLNDRDAGVMTDLDDALSTERDQAILANCDSIMRPISTRGEILEIFKLFKVSQDDQCENWKMIFGFVCGDTKEVA